MKILLFLFESVVVMAAAGDEYQVLKEFANGNIPYIGTLYKELVKENLGNLLICPLSIQTVFALVNSGARGNTAKEISIALNIPEGKENVQEVFTGLVKSLQTNYQYTLTSANKIYLANYFKIHSTYKTIAVDVFRSDIQNIDFSDTGKAIDEINGWVEEKTHNKIKDLASADTIGPDTIAVLINALYFQGTWLTKFDNVFKAPFSLNSNDSVFTNMMNTYELINYYDSSELKAKFVELPYKGQEVSLTIVLPYEVGGLSALEDNIIDVFKVPEYIPALVNVTIPKFKIETKTHLIPILQNMGIKDAFSSVADFTGIGANQERLVITEVLQKAFIEVNEEGTKAAAATMIVMSRSGRQYKEVEFVADHPFLFYLKHKVNGIFFVGRYVKAEEAA